MSEARWLPALLVLALAGCGSSEPPAPPEAPAAKEHRDSVFDPWVGTIDRAKDVQKTVDDQAAEQRRKLAEAER